MYKYNVMWLTFGDIAYNNGDRTRLYYYFSILGQLEQNEQSFNR